SDSEDEEDIQTQPDSEDEEDTQTQPEEQVVTENYQVQPEQQAKVSHEWRGGVQEALGLEGSSTDKKEKAKSDSE
ncbi:hypothetical protein A2U01_0102560, partial [Trifolium medium]|nr:hypothetical protein [Trifolium medium]